MPDQRPKQPTPAQLRYKAEVSMIFYSLVVQASLSLVVVLFSCYQLTKPVTKESNDSAIYVGLLTGALAYWFPSPANAYISTLSHQSRRKPPAPAPAPTSDD